MIDIAYESFVDNICDNIAMESDDSEDNIIVRFFKKIAELWTKFINFIREKAKAISTAIKRFFGKDEASSNSESEGNSENKEQSEDTSHSNTNASAKDGKYYVTNAKMFAIGIDIMHILDWTMTSVLNCMNVADKNMCYDKMNEINKIVKDPTPVMSERGKAIAKHGYSMYGVTSKDMKIMSNTVIAAYTRAKSNTNKINAVCNKVIGGRFSKKPNNETITALNRLNTTAAQALTQLVNSAQSAVNNLRSVSKEEYEKAVKVE